MSWSKLQINQHRQAARVLNKIIYQVAEFIKNNFDVTDVEVRQFIKWQYKKYHLISDKQKSIVAFGNDTANVHFYAKEPRRLKLGDLIMIDIWARLAKKGAQFADITWMLYYGRTLPREYAEAFKMVIETRDKAVKYLQRNLQKKVVPIGKDIDAVARDYLEKRGHGNKFLHSTGHSLGSVSPHGRRTRISRKGRQALPLNVGYTIEPGIYLKNFGIRSEIDFYIQENYKLIITTKVQNNIIII